MKKYILYSIILLSTLSSCRKEIKSRQGGIDIISNVYINASKNLDDAKNFHISRLNYSNDTIIELIPNVSTPIITNEMYFIKDTVFYSLGSPLDAQLTTLDYVVKTNKPNSIYHDKKSGAIFIKDKIPNYHKKRDLKDTILFDKAYKRFEINSPQSYSRYYIYQTDTILPYSLYKHAEIDYKGRIERIDTYNKKQDIFVTLQLLPRKKWDEEAKDIFKFNEFVNQKSKK